MLNENKSSIPWVEKYRPSRFEEIVLDNVNKTIFEILEKQSIFRNLLFYGPPGVIRRQQ